LEVAAMSTTPDRYFGRAASLKSGGESWRAILEDLRAAGASSMDLIRVVKKTENAGVGAAVKIIEDSGLPGFDATFTIVVPEGDPWYGQQLGSSDSRAQGD
jgi:hypothetical protein